MKLPDKYGDRLNTKNFRRVHSDAAISIDYYPKLKLFEVEYKTGKIYHYLQINKSVWKTISGLADKNKGLGAYINQEFKNMIEKNNFDYYELIMI